MRRAVAVAAGLIALGTGLLVGTTSAVVLVTSSPAHAPVPQVQPYVCIDGGDGQPGWACYLRGDAPAVNPGQEYVVTEEPASLPDSPPVTTEAPAVSQPVGPGSVSAEAAPTFTSESEPAGQRSMAHLPVPPTDGTVDLDTVPMAQGCEQITPELWFNHTTMTEGDGTCP